MDTPLDPERYRISSTEFESWKQIKNKPLSDQPTYYVPPIPLDWAVAAAECGDRGAELGQCLWFQYRVRKQNPFRLTYAALTLFHLNHRTAERTLKRMKEAGLVHVEFQRGRSPRVEILTNGS